MTRILPDPLAGQHPLCPERRAPGCANPCVAAFYIGGAAGTFLGAAGVIFGARSLTLPIRAAAYSSALFTGTVYVSQFLDNREARDLAARIDGVDLKPKRRVLFEKTGSLDTDDFIVGGAAIGTLLALNRRVVPGVVGWRRFLGMASIGSVIGSGSSFLILNQLLEAYPVQQQYMAENKQLRARYRAALADKHGQNIQETIASRVPMDGRGIKETERANQGERTAWHLPKIVKQFFEQSEPKPRPVVFEADDPGPISVGGPHLAIRVQGGFAPVPLPDYSWSPKSRASAKESLEEHLRNLTKKRDRLKSAADYIWWAVTAIETRFYLEPNDDAKNALMWLNSIHYSVCQDLTETGWLIADSEKKLTMLDGWPSLRAEADNEERMQKAKEHLDRRRAETLVSIWREKAQRLEATHRAVEVFELAERMTLGTLAAMQSAKARYLTETAAARDDNGNGAYDLQSLDELRLPLRTPQEEQQELQLEMLRALKKHAEDDLIRLSKADSSPEST